MFAYPDLIQVSLKHIFLNYDTTTRNTARVLQQSGMSSGEQGCMKALQKVRHFMDVMRTLLKLIVTEVGNATITTLLIVIYFSVTMKHFLVAGSLALIRVVSSLCDTDGGYAVYPVRTEQSSWCSD
jgi:hypothetical protein